GAREAAPGGRRGGALGGGHEEDSRTGWPFQVRPGNFPDLPARLAGGLGFESTPVVDLRPVVGPSGVGPAVGSPARTSVLLSWWRSNPTVACDSAARRRFYAALRRPSRTRARPRATEGEVSPVVDPAPARVCERRPAPPAARTTLPRPQVTEKGSS